MISLLEWKETIKNIYAKYDNYIMSVLKFLLALCTFQVINVKLGQLDKLNSLILVLIVSLACSFLPVNALVLIGTAFIMGHLYALSLEALLVGGGILLILLLIYFGIAPKQGLALLLTPIALVFQIPCAIPLVFGLVAAPSASLGILFGTAGYYILHSLNTSAGKVSASAKEASEAMMQKIQGMLDGILKNPEMIVMLVTMGAVILLVYMVRRMAIRNAWSIAIGLGACIFILIQVIGSVMLGFEAGIVGIVIGTLVSAAIAAVVKLFIFSVDYKRTELVQFEDDEYYYFVKAVPKLPQIRKKAEYKPMPENEVVRRPRREID